MNHNLFAVMIHTHREPFEALRRTLRDLSVETQSVTSCKDAHELIARSNPNLIFTESCIADGTWASVLNMAEAEEDPLKVIVVGHFPDTKRYISVMERGAFDFIAPPFEHEPMSFLVKSAAKDLPSPAEPARHYALA